MADAVQSEKHETIILLTSVSWSQYFVATVGERAKLMPSRDWEDQAPIALTPSQRHIRQNRLESDTSGPERRFHGTKIRFWSYDW